MRVLVLGAGLIGGALADALSMRAHQVLLATRDGRTRPGMGAVALDLAALPDAATLQRALAGVDVVVNTVGIFRATAQQDFDAVHVKGPRLLLEAARAAGVRRWVQVSALGADSGSPLPYFSSKGQAEAEVRASGLEYSLVRPSLVFAPAGASTRLFALLASLPLAPLPGGGWQQVQPLHLHDLVAALGRVVEAAEVPAVLDAVGPRALSLRDYLAGFRRAMGAWGRFVALPGVLARVLAGLGARWRRLPFDRDALAMLDAGNTADPAAFAAWLGRAPRDPDHFIAPDQAAPLRQQAVLAWTVPTMRVALAMMWIATAVVSLWVHPRQGSLALLGQVGLHGGLAVAALWSAALLDLALGAALLVARQRALVYLAQLLLVGSYTIIISIFLPEQWGHPFGPVLKNVPLLAMILSLMALDRRRPWT